MTAMPCELTAEDRAALLRLARGVIEGYLRNRRPPETRELVRRITSGLAQRAGGFVTLHRNGELRGCIGEILPERALHHVVRDHALNAAFRDPRFPPLAAKELAEVDIEISALTPPAPIDSWRGIEIGRHGVVLHKSGRSSVFLPQVAPEQGWDVPTMLDYLAMKAGLPADAWREDAELEVFEAVVFGERDQPVERT